MPESPSPSAVTSTAAASTEFSTTRPSEVARIYQSVLGVDAELRPRAGFAWSMRHLNLGSVSVNRVSGTDMQTSARPEDAYFIATVDSGRLHWRSEGVDREFGPGEAGVLGQPGRRHTSRMLDGAAFRSVGIDARLIRDLAGGRVEFSDRSGSGDAQLRWNETVAHLERLTAGSVRPMPPLMLREANRFLAAMALATFAHTVHPVASNGFPGRAASRSSAPSGTHPADDAAAAFDGRLGIPEARQIPEPVDELTDRGSGRTVRQAVEFMQRHADEPITSRDIAASVNVTERAVQLAFRQHLGQSPMQYLRRIRLDRVHAELRAADPTGDDTVTTVAARWGFGGSTRFSAYYREAYGVLPSTTLATT